ncbi:type II toxin-antitoxin system PemK/MazF family toxin [Latilactobacillus curvatus]|uniref:type II toxin-antitoxin system PemK/MazF family toxin n=1 Tax=Latilactobacillus curvatus TaxID=28038 RepID=UPI00217DE93F|nr:type II toxin-antitoxin system PemK/MazF family toxin [Latilactobacillus curvatus]MCS6142283.1 type II toxin-antitoxin system PemK/MazF family toxin [Latilactobacillus curvatus]
MNEIIKKEEDLNYWHQKKIKVATKEITFRPVLSQMSLRAGALYWANLGENIGTEQNKFRPVIILSTERINNGDAIIAPLSTKNGTVDSNYKPLNLEFIIKKINIENLNEESKLVIKDYSVVKVGQIRLLNSARFDEKIGNISPDLLNKIKIRIKTIFDI